MTDTWIDPPISKATCIVHAPLSKTTVSFNNIAVDYI